MSRLRHRPAQGPGELTAPPGEPGGTRYEFGCPRCAGSVHGFEDAGAVVCSFCGSAFYSRPDRDCGWVLLPRLTPRDGLAAARRWLRESGRRVRAFDLPAGVLLPGYWARGRFLVWELADAARLEASGEADTAAAAGSGVEELWEPRFSVEAYAHTFPAHPLTSLLPGRHTRLESATLRLLEPDRFPAGFRLVEPTVTLAQAEVMRAEWLGGRTSRSRRPSARLASSERIHLVVFPLIVVPFLDGQGRRCVVAVDALSGTVLGLVPEACRPRELEAGPGSRDVPGIRPPSFLRPLECANCGAALAPEGHDRLHGCGNCGSVWELDGVRPRAIRQWMLEGKSTQHWLPFWLFGDATPADAPPRGAVFVPAYGARHPEAQLHLAARLTRRPPQGNWSSDSFEVRRGASIGTREAREWRWALEGILSRKTLRSFLEFVRDPAPRENRDPAGLAWIPFEPEGLDLVEPTTGARTGAAGTEPWASLRSAS